MQEGLQPGGRGAGQEEEAMQRAGPSDPAIAYGPWVAGGRSLSTVTKPVNDFIDVPEK